MQLRAMLCELGTPSIPSLLPISEIGTALTADGNPEMPWLDKAASRFEELVWYAEALRRQRAERIPYRPAGKGIGDTGRITSRPHTG
jgi:hypothetical protein